MPVSIGSCTESVHRHPASLQRETVASPLLAYLPLVANLVSLIESSAFSVLADNLATPLNLSNAASLDLLSVDEQTLCSTLRVLPKPYLAIKEMYLRENERRKGLLKRRDARLVSRLTSLEHHD